MCPVVFILLCDLSRSREVLKLMKNAQFLVHIAVWFLFLKIFGMLRTGLY